MLGAGAAGGSWLYCSGSLGSVLGSAIAGIEPLAPGLKLKARELSAAPPKLPLHTEMKSGPLDTGSERNSSE